MTFKHPHIPSQKETAALQVKLIEECTKENTMLLKEIFDKATSENKSLTLEEFEAIAKESKAKFTDLSEGRYVDRQKYEDDLAKKDTEIASLNETITTRNTDLESLKTQLQSAGSDAGKLEELTNNFSALQEKYNADTAALQTKLSEQAYEFAVRDFAGKQKFSSSAARRDFERSMIQKNLPMEDGSIMGADDYMKAYAKANADAFIAKETPKQPDPQFVSTANGDKGKTGTKMTLSEMMKAKNENPDFEVKFD